MTQLQKLKLRVIQVALVALLLALKVELVQGQESNRSTKLGSSITEVSSMTAEKFEAWIKVENKKADVQQVKPLVTEDALMGRLRDGKDFTEETAIAVIDAWIGYESTQTINARKVKPNNTKYSFPNSKRVIDEIMPFLYGRLNLQAKLHEEKAYLFRTEDEHSSEAQEYKKALQILNPFHLDIDRRRVETTLFLAQTSNRIGEKQKAEDLYLQVLGYPFWKITDASSLQYMRGLYVSAGKGLIELRRGHLKALQQTNFIPSAMDELEPELEDAIKQAGG